VIMRKCFNITAVLLTALTLFSVAIPPAAAQDASQDPNKTPYTIPEYNAFQACRAEKDPTALVKCLDDFSAKFPNSTLLVYVYQLYYPAYFQLKNYPKAMQYADKVASLGDKVDQGVLLQAIQTHVQLFPYATDAKAADYHDQLAKERDAALQGAKLLTQFPKPKDTPGTDDEFAQKKKAPIAAFFAAAGSADLQLKDYDGAAEAFKSALANNPTDAISEYNLGRAYLAMAPPKSLDGFWAVARAISLKVPDDAKIKDYLRAQILAYEQPGCDTQVDAQLSELLQLAANAPERPATYTIPGTADLQKIVQASTILTILSDLQAGGDKAKMTWLALCGAQFPEVVGKIIDLNTAGDVVTFQVFTSANQEEMQNATVANMEVKVPGQPEAARLLKGDPIQFTGTVVAYDAQPFMLHWDKCKVDPSVIPDEKKAGRKPAPKKPAN
jgi:tetratricopeptide (TPR) repeat protein